MKSHRIQPSGKFRVFFTAVVLGSLVSNADLRANELVLSEEAFQAMGYEPAKTYLGLYPTVHEAMEWRDLPRNLDWPVTFTDRSHTIAQNYVNYQNYGNSPYFHGGCDLRSRGNSDVVAPVAGILEGGFYGYVQKPDGSMEKQWRPWDGVPRADPYFEIAIVTEEGYRFEFHHVDSQRLPATIIQALDRGSARIQPGEVIGKVNGWAFQSQRYDHIHYNVIRPDGVRANPEYYSKAVPDQVAPRIHGVYGMRVHGGPVEIKDGETLTGDLTELIVATTESRDLDAYVQTPPFAEVQFPLGGSSRWDFRQFLKTSLGTLPDIRKVFLPEITLSNGHHLETTGQFGHGMFLIRLPISSSDKGKFVITVGDTAGNNRHFSATLL